MVFIKTLTISNFRSFRQQPEVHPFSPATNCVVGRNGSGKSNLFAAVSFVLCSAEFQTLRLEERQALLHEGSGSTAVNAFVEIVFDNSDNRFSMENSDEVVLRRTVGHKKDEFFLQRKRATKNEVLSLLEGAGFSKSNPYYIVQQGKVTALCTMNDTERLNLLREVAGTTVYDEKKAESLKKMEENMASIEKINEILDSIEERLTELKGEKEELTQYQQLDRERRAIEYTLYDKELRKARKELDEIEKKRTKETDELSELHEQARLTHDEIRSVEARMKAKTNAKRRNRLLLTNLEQDKSKAIQLRTQLDLECKELLESIKMGTEIRQANERELGLLSKQIAEARGELEKTVQPQYESAAQKVTLLTHERDEARRKMQGLYAKQGRGRQFTSKEDRDAYLERSIQEQRTVMADKGEQRDEAKRRLADSRKLLVSQEKEITKLEDTTGAAKESMTKLSSEIDEKKRHRATLAESRTTEWRQAEMLMEKVKEARENLDRAKADMRKAMPRATSQGLDSLERIVAQEGLVHGEQYFGSVLRNFELVDPKYQAAVEVAAQNSLFHVIVDTDATAARLMKRLEDERLGRITFLPLNRLRVENVNYPDSSDVRPLMRQCISFDARVARAMTHVFGKKLLARSVEVASFWSAKASMDAITLDGDVCSRKGALTGGFVDASRSRLRAHIALASSQKALSVAQEDHRKVNIKAHGIDQSITNLMGELQRLEAEKVNLNHTIRECAASAESVKHHQRSTQKSVETLEREMIPSLEHEVSSLQSEIQRLEEEVGTELVSALSEEERTLVSELKASSQDLTKEIDTTSETLSKLHVERQRLESLLNDNLIKRRDELLSEGAESRVGGAVASQTAPPEDLEHRQEELETATRTCEEIEAKLVEAQRVDDELRGELIASKNEHDKLKATDVRNQQELDAAQEESEKLLSKRSTKISKRETYMRKIQELGSLPPPAELANFSGMTIPSLMRVLEKVNKKLKRYSHVNKKAYDQYVNFSEQREALLKRKEELDRGAQKVEELVESLDQKKDEAINRTFRGVSAHFRDVFKELVPNGGGELVMRTSLDETVLAESDSDPDSQATDPRNPDVSLYRGVGVKVRFSPVGENYLMSQLSGGQKALVAMALIFAIQRSDPAPFYLFDELDQALDSTHRAAVSALIQKQANHADNPTQFIVSTFRPELVEVANRCYGISHQNKVSSVHHLSKKDARHFIASLQSEEEAVGEVSTVTHSRASRGSSLLRKRKAAATDEQDEADEDA